MISILLIEDHGGFARVMIRLLSTTKDMEIVQVADTAEKGLEELSKRNFDLVLVDVSLPEMSGISFVRIARSQHPNLLCLMLSGHTPSHYVQRALEAGAHGYILKDDGPRILDGIRQVLRGKIYVSSQLHA